MNWQGQIVTPLPRWQWQRFPTCLIPLLHPTMVLRPQQTHQQVTGPGKALQAIAVRRLPLRLFAQATPPP